MRGLRSIAHGAVLNERDSVSSECGPPKLVIEELCSVAAIPG